MRDEPSPDDLGVLEPATATAQTAAGSATFRELAVRDLAPMARALGPARDVLAEAATDWDSADLAQIIADHEPAITAGIAVACQADPDTIGGLCLDDYARCLAAMVEANRSFFRLWLGARTRPAATQ